MKLSEPFTATAPPKPPFSYLATAVLLMKVELIILTSSPWIATPPPKVVSLSNSVLTENLKS